MKYRKYGTKQTEILSHVGEESFAKHSRDY